jgi:hypothetical protein
MSDGKGLDPLHKRTTGIGTVEYIVSEKSFGQTIEKRRDRKEFKVSFKNLPPIEGTPAIVGTTRGLTLSLGSFEFARVDVSLQLPCNADSIEEAYQVVEKWVDDKVESQVKSIRKASDSK